MAEVDRPPKHRNPRKRKRIREERTAMKRRQRRREKEALRHDPEEVHVPPPDQKWWGTSYGPLRRHLS